MAEDPHTDEAYQGDISSARARSSDPASSLKRFYSSSADISLGMKNRTPSGKILPASEKMQGRIGASFTMRSMSEMTESSPESAEGKGKSLRYTTGIASTKRAFDCYSFNQPPLSDLLKRCEILDSKYHSDPNPVERLATLVTEGKLTNGLCTRIWPSNVARSVESFVYHHPNMNILLIDWNSHLFSSFKHTQVLQISLGPTRIFRNISEGEPGYHIKIFLDDDWTQLTEDDHVSIFQSVVMPVAEEFKPDMVFFIFDDWAYVSLTRPISCIGHLIGMLMKVADGKVVVCCDSYESDITEVSLCTLLSDNKDSLPDPSHPSPVGSNIIERTVKKYGEHWKCLRERYSPARMAEDEYSELKGNEEVVETTSKTAPSIFTEKSEMTKSPPGSAESKERELRCTTGIAISKWLFNRSFNQSSLSNLMKRCEILSSEDRGYSVGHTSINELVTLVAEEKLTNGLCIPTQPSDVARSIKSLVDHHPNMNILLIDWNSHFFPSFKHTRVLQISLGPKRIFRNISEGEPAYHIKIFLDDDWTQLTEDDHVSIFRSVVMPATEEFKPDIVFYVSMTCPISCIGHLIGMLMKVADGKVVVCCDDDESDIIEVSLSTLLSDNEDCLPDPSHPTAEGSKIIEMTVKKYGEHWKCLREGNSPERMAEDKYSALKETEEEVGTNSKTGLERDLHSLEEVVAADDNGGEKSQDQMNMSLPSTSLERVAVKLEDLRLPSLQSTDSVTSDDGCEISQTLYKLADPSVELGELAEEFNHFLAQDIGIEGGNIELHSHEIHFPENAVDETIHTKSSISLGTDLDLPSSLIPISHVLHCSPGKKIFNKHVTIKMPVWFKLASIAQPVNILVYSRHEGQPWEHEKTVALGTAEAISFHCLHFCKKVIVVDADDIMNGEFSIDYFLCMNRTGNFLSCHCVSTDIMVDKLVKRFKDSGYKVIHPAVNRISEECGTEIPISLVSRQPQLYEVQPENGHTLVVSASFYRKRHYKCFPFELTFTTGSRPDTFSLMYGVGDEAFPIRERTREFEVPPSDKDRMLQEGSDLHGKSLVHVEIDAHVGNNEINANTYVTRHGSAKLNQKNCVSHVSSKTEIQPPPPSDKLNGKSEDHASRSPVATRSKDSRKKRKENK